MRGSRATTDRVRIGAVAYLNTRPLVFGLENGLADGRIELSYDTPAGLADRLAGGGLDVALLPTIELARIPDLEIVPGLGITCRGATRSVVLVSRRPPREIDRVLLDPESRTSNALLQVLFDRVWRRTPEFAPGPLDLGEALRESDAVLRIGDKALFEPLPEDVETHDLGTVWTERTGLPFVFAVWSCRPGVVDRELYRMLHASRRDGSRALDRIAREYSWNGCRQPEVAARYLRENIAFRLGSDEIRAIETFHAAAARLGIIDRVPGLRPAIPRRRSCDDPAAGLPHAGAAIDRSAP